SKKYGEEIMACVIIKEGEEVSSEEIIEYVKSNLATYKAPSYVSFVDAFPMNAAGKILKYKLREDAVETLRLQEEEGIETA
ncbi:MAG: AMP-binding protein, partial [Eubacteriales bacterium]|nr:AMP-binding protein [Eubacteriales bacterium]